MWLGRRVRNLDSVFGTDNMMVAWHEMPGMRILQSPSGRVRYRDAEFETSCTVNQSWCRASYRSLRSVSDFAAKRLEIIAQGFSPGSCVARIRPESGGRVVSLGSSRVILTTPNIGCHFQGTFHRPPDPGLKPWAVLYSRFAAKSDKPLGDGSYPRHSQAFHAWLPSFNPFGIIKHG